MNIAQRLSNKARQEGRQEGGQEKQREIARALLAKGVDREVVKQCTGLSEQEIAELNH